MEIGAAPYNEPYLSGGNETSRICNSVFTREFAEMSDQQLDPTADLIRVYRKIARRDWDHVQSVR